MPAIDRLRRNVARSWGGRTSGDVLVNRPAGLWPYGVESPITSDCAQCGGRGCSSCVWAAGAGQGLTVGGSHMDMGYGYGLIGPNGPDRGNWPGPLPQAWWNTGGVGGGLLPAVTRATQIITSPTVRNVWEITSNHWATEERVPHWVSDPMGARTSFGPSTASLPTALRMTGHDYWSTVLTHAIWWGRGVMMFEVNELGRPIAGTFQVLNPFLVHEVEGRYVLGLGEDYELRFEFDGSKSFGGKRYQIRVLRGLPPHSEGDFFGGVLIRHGLTFGIGARVQSYESSTFDSGIPAGVLSVSTPNFGAEKAEELRRAWERAHGGDRRGIAVLNSGVSFSPVSLNPVEADLSKLKQSNLVDVAHAFGISASWLDTASGDSDTYANLVDRRRDLVDHTLAEWGESLMQVIDTMLPAGQRARVRWRDYTAADFGATLGQAVAAKNAGLITEDEARQLIGYMPLQGEGDLDA